MGINSLDTDSTNSSAGNDSADSNNTTIIKQE